MNISSCSLNCVVLRDSHYSFSSSWAVVLLGWVNSWSLLLLGAPVETHKEHSLVAATRLTV